MTTLFDQNKIILDPIMILLEESIINFCSKLTKNYDKSHDVEHHKKVWENAKTIIFEMLKTNKFLDKCYETIVELTMFSSLLHDTVDHKYGNENREELEKFVKENSDNFDDIMWIIDNISFSKELKNGYPKHKKNYVELARNIVSDSDKIEALGKGGVKRMIYFSRAKGVVSYQKIIDHIKTHSSEKLLRLYNEFIRTKEGKNLALPLHNELKDIIEDEIIIEALIRYLI